MGEPPRDEVRRDKFALGALESVELEVWRVEGAEDVTRALLHGRASMWSFWGAPFQPEIYIEVATDPNNIWDDPLEDLILGAYEGNLEAAEDLAHELEVMARNDWITEMERQWEE